MSVWRGIAPAKLNLFLRIVGRRADGYHLLFTLFQTVRFADRVEVELRGGEGIVLEHSGIDVGVPEHRNLAWRAAEAFFRGTGYPGGCSVRLEKVIPHGTGLGGGSSDAAAVLRGLNALTGGALAEDDLHRTAVSLGADVPFLLRGGTAIGRGVGEVLLPAPELAGGTVVLVVPGTPLATADVYATGTFALTENELEVSIPTSARGLLSMARRLGNDLAGPAQRLAPRLGEACREIEALGPDAGGMTGSGSALFALFRGREEAERAAERLAGHGTIVLTEPLTRKEFDESCAIA